MRLTILPATAALLLAGLAPAQAAPIDAIRAGDMNQMIEEIIAVYEDAGLSWDRGNEWLIGPFTTTYWFYNANEDEVHVGAVPADDEIVPYWQAWSTTLTDGYFDPDSFFASAEEAREMAHYNQYVLATHESAHAMTFRYDYPHLIRHDYDINCREYYADRLTVAILNAQAEAEPDMARWRDRYLDLVIAMGETIPEQYRYHIADFATLDADCAVIDVKQPTPETLQPYASAYFERYRVLLEAELPPMAAIFKTHLSDAHTTGMGAIPYAEARDGLELATLAELEEFDLGRFYGAERGESDIVSRAAAFGPDGKLWFATLHYDRATGMIDLAFGNDPEESPPVSTPGQWAYPSVSAEISSLAVLTPEIFVFTLQHWDREGADEAERHLVSFLLASRDAEGQWSLARLADVDGMHQGAILRAPDDRLFMLATPDTNGRDPTQNWRGFEISLERADVVEQLQISSGFDFPLAIDGEGRLYEELSYLLWSSTPDGVDAVIIGNGLAGPRDGIGAKAELSDVQVLQWMPGGRALFVDRGPGWRGFRLRELKPAQ